LSLLSLQKKEPLGRKKVKESLGKRKKNAFSQKQSCFSSELADGRERPLFFTQEKTPGRKESIIALGGKRI